MEFPAIGGCFVPNVAPRVSTPVLYFVETVFSFGKSRSLAYLNPKQPLSTLICTRYLCHRPHRIRLLKEIRRRKSARESAKTKGRRKRSDTIAGTRAGDEVTTSSTLHDGRTPVEELTIAQKPVSSMPATSMPPETPTLEASPLHTAREKGDASKQILENGQPDKGTDSSSTSTACTPYEDSGTHAPERSPLARDCAVTPPAVGDNFQSPSIQRNDGRGREAPPTSLRILEPLQSRGGGVSSIQESDALAGGSATTTGVKGTLQVSGVRAGDMRIALGGNDPFLQVKTCDQLRRTNAVTGKGE